MPSASVMVLDGSGMFSSRYPYMPAALICDNTWAFHNTKFVRVSFFDTFRFRIGVKEEA